jgi:hypothetical protein
MDQDNVIVAHNDIFDIGFNVRVPAILKDVLRECVYAVHPNVIFGGCEADDIKLAGSQRTSVDGTIAVAG